MYTLDELILVRILQPFSLTTKEWIMKVLLWKERKSLEKGLSDKRKEK